MDLCFTNELMGGEQGREKLTIYVLQQAMFAFVLVHAALRPSSTVGKNLARVRSFSGRTGMQVRFTGLACNPEGLYCVFVVIATETNRVGIRTQPNRRIWWRNFCWVCFDFEDRSLVIWIAIYPKPLVGDEEG